MKIADLSCPVLLFKCLCIFFYKMNNELLHYMRTIRKFASFTHFIFLSFLLSCSWLLSPSPNCPTLMTSLVPKKPKSFTYLQNTDLLFSVQVGRHVGVRAVRLCLANLFLSHLRQRRVCVAAFAPLLRFWLHKRWIFQRFHLLLLLGCNFVALLQRFFSEVVLRQFPNQK